MVNTVEGFTEIYESGQDSRGLLVVLVQVLVDLVFCAFPYSKLRQFRALVLSTGGQCYSQKIYYLMLFMFCEGYTGDGLYTT